MLSFFRTLWETPTGACAALLCCAVILVNGWTDAPNAIATAVVTRALSWRAAVVLSALCNLLGVLVMTSLNATVAATVFEVADFGGDGNALLALTCAMLAIVLWATLAFLFGIPTSESHALIAGLSGSAVAFCGDLSGLSGAAWAKVLSGLFLSVALGFLAGLLLCLLLCRLSKNVDRLAAVRGFAVAQTVGCAAMSFMHGAQDGQKFLGVLLLCTALSSGNAPQTPPTSAVLLCAALMALGTAIGGKKIVKATGQDMIRPESHQGFCADVAAALTLLCGSLFGIPLSTTHVKTCALMGTGAARRLSSVRLSVVGQIALTWALTFPGCGLLGYLLTRLALYFAG